MMDGQETPNDPILKSNVDVDQLAHVIGEYSRRIERIWNFAGGPSIQSLERLTVWVLRNSDVVGSWHTLLGGICGAFAYGEKELAHELIAQLMSEWEDLRRLAPTDGVLAVYDHVRGQVERLQEAVKRPTLTQASVLRHRVSNAAQPSDSDGQPVSVRGFAGTFRAVRSDGIA